MTNYEIAQEISAKIGVNPVPFESVYSICLSIYNELGGAEEEFDSVYSILLEILPMVQGGLIPTPTGSTTITENGTYNVTDKALATVNVPTGVTPTGSIEITENGTYNVTDKASAIVQVPTGITPSGTVTFTTNGTYDVTNKATAKVNVPQPSGTIIITGNTDSVDVSRYANASVGVPKQPNWGDNQKYWCGYRPIIAFYLENVPSGTTITIAMSRTEEEYPNQCVVYWGNGSTDYNMEITGHTYTIDYSGWVYVVNYGVEGSVEITNWGNIFTYCKAINICSEQNDATKPFDFVYPTIPTNSVGWYGGYTVCTSGGISDKSSSHLTFMNNLSHINHIFLADTMY